jgi:hypothetical protein
MRVYLFEKQANKGGLWGALTSTKGAKTKIWYIPVYRKGFENKVYIDFLATSKFNGNLTRVC